MAAPAAHADTGPVITTVAGGRGTGPALELAQDIVDAAVTPSRIYVIDARFGQGYVLRAVVRSTGRESPPLRFYAEDYTIGRHEEPRLAVLPNGNALVAYQRGKYGLIEEVDPHGGSRTVAGGGRTDRVGVDGLPATAEALGMVQGLAVAPNGAVYLSENVWDFSTSHYGELVSSQVRKIGAGGRITTVAGAPRNLGSTTDPGPALLTRFARAEGLALDPSGNLYVADSGLGRIRKVAAGLITTVATASTHSVTWFNGSLYTADWVVGKVFRVDGGSLVPYAGNGVRDWDGDGGPAVQAAALPVAVTNDGRELSFVQEAVNAFSSGGVLRTVGTDGVVRHVVGNGRVSHSGDGGAATDAQFAGAGAVVADSVGNTYLTDDPWLRRISPDGTIDSIVGPPPGERFPSAITGLALGPAGRVYYGDGEGHVLRIEADGSKTLVATGYTGPLAIAPNGDLLASGRRNPCGIYRIDATGAASLVVGRELETCVTGWTPDGSPALGAVTGGIGVVGFDPLGRLVFSEQGTGYERLVRRVEHDGTLTTVAGGGTSQASGVPATQAKIGPFGGTAIDALGRLALVDTVADQLLMVGTDGVIRRVAGGGSGPDGGPALGAMLLSPTGVAVDATGDVLVRAFDARPDGVGGVLRKVSGL